MAKIKYYYNTETCRYERVKVSFWEMFFNVSGFLLLAFMLGFTGVYIYYAYTEPPQVARLKNENKELKEHVSLLDNRISRMEDVQLALTERDENIYRAITEAEPLPLSIRNAGAGGHKKYEELLGKKLRYKDLIISRLEKLDSLKRTMYIQSKSYDKIAELAKNKAKMLASIPAIQPISNTELKRLASGFGMRMHPIYKVKKMHTGCDFSAPQGTPIYATGDGVIKRAVVSAGGYGIQVEIDHDYGYVTKYAHMSKFIVKRGQKVKRGEKIGYVGNTGTSVAPHLHYEVIHNDRKVNPVHYFFNDLDDEEYEKILELASLENQSLS